LNNISNEKTALLMRDFLRGFYEQLKENDRYIKFAFLTGISKFSKASIFSGLNQIKDISLMRRFGNICGYTQEELEFYFKDYLVEIDLENVKKWYNGYNFLADNVYNPFDILQFVDNDFMFKSYWWESGNPFSLIELLKTKDYFIPSLEHLKTDGSLIDSFDIEDLQIESLLFQAGYLTIDKIRQKRNGAIEYYLKVPNLEVQISLNNLFIKYLSQKINLDVQDDVYDTLYEANIEKFKETLISLFASIPYNNYIKNNIASYEGYWASLVYCYLAGSGIKVIAEDVTNSGRIDLTLMIKENIYIFEFKTDNENPLKQIKEKRYYEKYLNQNKNIYLIGISFNKEKRNIEKFEWERLLN
jgi:hypothetical protein